MLATETVTPPEARELLTECCALLGRNRFNPSNGRPVSGAQCLFRAELMVRDAFDVIGEDYDRPTIFGVFQAADVIAKQESISHPGLVAQLDRLTTHIMQRAIQ
ncbi:MAG: hypothetical protein FDZ75_04535 [Actinobacteria bacterium]|nr:MAG: hypothetical protein FDZ75_04535 [Actinomycetota bacterium]